MKPWLFTSLIWSGSLLALAGMGALVVLAWGWTPWAGALGMLIVGVVLSAIAMSEGVRR